MSFIIGLLFTVVSQGLALPLQRNGCCSCNEWSCATWHAPSFQAALGDESRGLALLQYTMHGKPFNYSRNQMRRMKKKKKKKRNQAQASLEESAEFHGEVSTVFPQSLPTSTGKNKRLHIPKIIFFVGNWDPEELVNKSKTMVKPGTEFRYFSIPQMQASVAKISKLLEIETGTCCAWEAFSALRPVAFRVDLWRAMVLWESGGVYVDAKIQLTAPVSTWVDDHNDLSLCHDIDLDYWNAMLAAPRRSPMLLAIIRKIIHNVRRRWYPDGMHSDLFITSPGAYTDALHAYNGKPHCVCQLGSDGHKITARGRVVAEINEEIHQAMRTCPTCNSYSELFRLGQIYCDEPGPPCDTEPESVALTQVAHDEYWSKVVW